MEGEAKVYSPVQQGTLEKLVELAPAVLSGLKAQGVED